MGTWHSDLWSYKDLAISHSKTVADTISHCNAGIAVCPPSGRTARAGTGQGERGWAQSSPSLPILTASGSALLPHCHISVTAQLVPSWGTATDSQGYKNTGFLQKQGACKWHHWGFLSRLKRSSWTMCLWGNSYNTLQGSSVHSYLPSFHFFLFHSIK